MWGLAIKEEYSFQELYTIFKINLQVQPLHFIEKITINYLIFNYAYSVDSLIKINGN